MQTSQAGFPQCYNSLLVMYAASQLFVTAEVKRPGQ